MTLITAHIMHIHLHLQELYQALGVCYVCLSFLVALARQRFLHDIGPDFSIIH